MLALARKRLGDGANLTVAELGAHSPFSDDSVDDVVASLVQPVPAARELFPMEYGALTTAPSFLFFVLHARLRE